MTVPVDPIVTSVIQHRLLAIVEEMGDAMFQGPSMQLEFRIKFPEAVEG